MIIIAMVISLILSTFAFNNCSGKADDFETREPTKDQMVLLEKIYNEFGNFKIIPDILHVKGQGTLCGSNVKIEIDLESDYYQKPDETLKLQGGDCEDFAILFVSAAKNIGVSARVIEGKVGDKEKPEEHVWSEIYYHKKWQVVDPWLKVKRPDSSFYRFINSREYNSIEVFCKYDDEKILGSLLPRQILEAEKTRVKADISNFFLETYRQEKRGEPSQDELKGLEKITNSFFEKTWKILQERIPEDPRFLIQPNNAEVKVWIEEIKINIRG